MIHNKWFIWCCLEPWIRGSFYPSPLLKADAMASSADRTQLLDDIDQKLKWVKECFECFWEDFKNITYVGGDIRERLGDCCVESIRPFEGMIDGFLDTLNTFDWGLKTTLDAWLRIHSHLAGRCYS